MKTSVCMATYNGERYVVEQIYSILDQLKSDDEIIVVDDCSSDNTVKIIQNINDPRIKVYSNEQNRSHVFTFNRVISLANNDIIFMADQDDIWMKGRIQLMTNELLRTNKLLISSNSDFIDADGILIKYHLDGVSSKDSNRYVKNIWDIFKGKTNYVGCAMAFKKDMNKIILPIPSFVESHDLWIALAGNIMRSNLHMDEKTLHRRVHNNNASMMQRNIFLKIWSRIIFLVSIIVIVTRLIRNSK